MEQFFSRTSVQVLNRRVNIQAVPVPEHGIAYFTFIVRHAPYSTPACISFSFHQASLLDEFHRLDTIARMLSCAWGSIAGTLSFVTLQYHLSNFCHQTIQQRNGLGVVFFTHLFLHAAGARQQRTNTIVREEMTDEVLVFTDSEGYEEEETDTERGLETAIAGLERVGGAGVAEEEGCCSICLEEFKETIDHLDLARTPCLHVFHYDCIAQWLGRSRTCPLCRCEMRH